MNTENGYVRENARKFVRWRREEETRSRLMDEYQGETEEVFRSSTQKEVVIATTSSSLFWLFTDTSDVLITNVCV